MVPLSDPTKEKIVVHGDRQVTFSSDGNIYYEEYNSQIHPKWGVHMIDEIKVVNGINHETIKDAFNWVYRL